jgi:hypothetical protein
MDHGPAARISAGRPDNQEVVMRIALASVMFEDQDRTLEFYTGILRFARKNDIPMREFADGWGNLINPVQPAA